MLAFSQETLFTLDHQPSSKGYIVVHSAALPVTLSYSRVTKSIPQLKYDLEHIFVFLSLCVKILKKNLRFCTRGRAFAARCTRGRKNTLVRGLRVMAIIYVGFQ